MNVFTEHGCGALGARSAAEPASRPSAHAAHRQGAGGLRAGRAGDSIAPPASRVARCRCGRGARSSDRVGHAQPAARAASGRAGAGGRRPLSSRR